MNAIVEMKDTKGAESALGLENHN